MFYRLSFGKKKYHSAFESILEFHILKEIAETLSLLNQLSVNLIDKRASLLRLGQCWPHAQIVKVYSICSEMILTWDYLACAALSVK